MKRKKENVKWILVLGYLFLLWSGYLSLSTYSNGRVQILSKKLHKLGKTVDKYQRANNQLRLDFYAKLKEQKLSLDNAKSEEEGYQQVRIKNIPIVEFHF